jgi:gamma-glutamyltranspeptidase/glutathione hydrolase
MGGHPLRKTPMNALHPSRLGALALAAALAGCASAPTFHYTAPSQPEAASGYTEKPGWTTAKFAVAAANPLATDAGYQVLKAGGSAVDAAIAVQMVLTLVEPQSSGIGGGAFLLHASGGKVEAYDGRETAPAAADEKLFLDARRQAPGLPRRRGRRPLGRRARHRAHAGDGAPPARQAALGRAVPAGHPTGRGRLQGQPAPEHAAEGRAHLKKDPVAAAYFFTTRRQRLADVGHLLKNPELAAVLRAIAADGSARPCLRARWPRPSWTRCRSTPPTPASSAWPTWPATSPRSARPMCHDYRGPRAGLPALRLPAAEFGRHRRGADPGHPVEHPTPSPAAAGRPATPAGPAPSADWLHLYTEASRLAFADRALYVADPDFVQPPAGSWMSLLDPAYLASRARS